MINWRIIIVLVIPLLLLAGLGLSQEMTSGDKPNRTYYLNEDSTTIINAMTGKPITSVDMMPDTAPEYVPRSRFQKFDNQKFHFLEVSPNGRYAAFASGEGDEWMGVLAPQDRYMKFLLYSIETRFYGARWSPDSKYLAFAYNTPDRRLHIQIVRPPQRSEPRYEAKNAWQMPRANKEQLIIEGWQIEGSDTSYAFVVQDSLGNELHRGSLSPHRLPKGPVEDSGEE